MDAPAPEDVLAPDLSEGDRALCAPRSPQSPAGTHVAYPRERTGLPYRDNGETFGRYWSRISIEDAVRLTIIAKQLGMEPRSAFRYVREVGDDAPPQTSERVRLDAAIVADVYDEHGRRCGVCGASEGEFHIDHKVPLARGGTNDRRNLWVLCAPCNVSKGARTVEEFTAARQRRAEV